MKKYLVTCDDTYNTLHRHVGGQAYIAIAFGNHNDIAQYIVDNNINMDETV